MKVTFDSNTYRRVTDPNRFTGDPNHPAFQKLHVAIVNKRIEPFLSETVASLEGVEKKHRGAFFAAAEAAFDVQAKMLPDGTVTIEIAMGPNDALHPGVPPQAEKWLKDAVGLGFRFLRAPRIGLPRPQFLIDASAYAAELDAGPRLDRYHQVGRAIEARGVGFAAPKAIGGGMKQRIGSTEPWFAVLDQPKDIHEERAIERSIGEWADGDTVAAHIGYDCDVLCTEDQGKSAGAASIFDAANRLWLTSAYNVEFATLSELADRF